MLEHSLNENAPSSRPHSEMIYDIERFINLTLQRGVKVTKNDIAAVLDDIEETVEYIIENGGILNLPPMNISCSVSGVFESASDRFDPNRHKPYINISKDTLLRKREKETPQPQIPKTKDMENELNEAYNQVAIARESFSIAKAKLKISEDSYNPDNVGRLSNPFDVRDVFRQARDRYDEAVTNYFIKLEKYRKMTGKSGFDVGQPNLSTDNKNIIIN
jgi:hypothetical protein